MIIVNSGSGTVTNINTALPLSGGPITTSGTITTSMATNKLIGRSTAGTGVMEEITVGTGLTLSGGTLSSSGGGAAGSTNEIQFNNAAAFAASANLRWIISDNRLVLGTENTADTNSRMVIIGKGISTGNTFVVHNSTGTNNALVVKDDNFVGINTNSPLLSLPIGSTINSFSVGIPTVANAGFNINDRGVAYRRDVNGLVWLDYSNQNTSSSSAVVIRLSNSNTQASATIAKTGNAFTSNQFGNEAQSLVIFNKAASNNRIKFSLLSQDAASNSYYDFLAGDTGGGALPSDTNINGGVSQTSSIMRLIGNGNLLLGTTSQGASATKTLVINNGIAPTGDVTDSFQQYSADIVAGNAAPHFRTENGNVIKIYQETTGVASATFVQNSGNRVDEVSTFDGYTIAQVVRALRNQGLLA